MTASKRRRKRFANASGPPRADRPSGAAGWHGGVEAAVGQDADPAQRAAADAAVSPPLAASRPLAGPPCPKKPTSRRADRMFADGGVETGAVSRSALCAAADAAGLPHLGRWRALPAPGNATSMRGRRSMGAACCTLHRWFPLYLPGRRATERRPGRGRGNGVKLVALVPRAVPARRRRSSPI
jgi:hypothetical protein